MSPSRLDTDIGSILSEAVEIPSNAFCAKSQADRASGGYSQFNAKIIFRVTSKARIGDLTSYRTSSTSTYDAVAFGSGRTITGLG